MIVENNVIDMNEKLKQLGYMTKTPKVGELGQALMKVSKENPDCKWLKRHLDKFFQNLRKERKNERKK